MSDISREDGAAIEEAVYMWVNIEGQELYSIE